MKYSEMKLQESTIRKHSIPSKNDLIIAHERINRYINYTPVLHSSTLNQKLGCNVYFKCENFQKMGAFKMRGASNCLLKMNQNDLRKGVATHSS